MWEITNFTWAAENGVFLVRDSNTSPGDYVLSVLHNVSWKLFFIILRMLFFVIRKLTHLSSSNSILKHWHINISTFIQLYFIHWSLISTKYFTIKFDIMAKMHFIRLTIKRQSMDLIRWLNTIVRIRKVWSLDCWAYIREVVHRQPNLVDTVAQICCIEPQKMAVSWLSNQWSIQTIRRIHIRWMQKIKMAVRLCIWHAYSTKMLKAFWKSWSAAVQM